MKLFTLLYGKSKKRMHPIMTDERHKCVNYMNARGERLGGGWHKIEPSDKDAVIWRQKSATRNGNSARNNTVRRIGEGLSGYIGKNGFNAHT